MSTPEAWAGLKERLIGLANAIGHADLSRLYREDWLNRFYARRRPQDAARTFAPQRRGSFKNGRFVPPAPPVRQEARDIASSGIDASTARALILGFANFPEELPAHCEQLAALPIPDKSTAKMRDDLVNAAFSGATLDQEGIATILAPDGAATRTAREAIWPRRSRSSPRRRKWKRPWRMQRNG